ncbi:hypothetical protein KCU90_g486, partial [Aureobasidium melanogenum]
MRQLRLDVARRDCVDPHIAWRVLDAERARQTDYAVLRDRVRKASRNDLECMRRRDIHDAARAAFDHARQHRATAVPYAVEIDREAAAPIVVGHCQRIAEHVDAGVVDQHVERAERTFRLAHRVLNRRRLRHVRMHGQRTRTGLRLDLLRRLPRRFDIQLRQYDRRALARERECDRRADAAPGTGDQRNLVGEPLHFFAPARAMRNPLINAFACEAVTAALWPGLYSAEPRPKPFAPALKNGPMLSGVIPPTGTSGTCAAITARHAFTTWQPSCSAGNIFSTSAPFFSARKASFGVATPGAHAMPCAFAALTTSGSLCGITISSPPADLTSVTKPGCSTVPAPTIASAGKVLRIAAMLSNGCGEFNGTSTMRKPASYSA